MRLFGFIGAWVALAGCIIPDQPSSGCDPCHPCVEPGQVCIAGSCVSALDAGGSGDAGVDGGTPFLPGEVGPLDPAQVDGTQPHVIAAACDGTNFLVAWADTRAGGESVHFERFDPYGQVLPPGEVALSAAGSRPGGVCATFDGQRYFVAWDDGSAAVHRILGARVDPTGSVLDGTGFPIAPGVGADQRHPSCASTGRELFVTWTDSRDGGAEIFGARVALDAGLLDGMGFPVTGSPGADSAAVASDGQGYLVAWSDPNITSFPVIRGTRVTSTGQMLDLRDGGLAIGTRCGSELLPAIGVYQGEYAVLWEDHCTTPARIFSDRVLDDGGLVDQPNFVLSTSGASSAPAATSSGYQYFFAWPNGPAGGAADVFFAWYLNTSPPPGFDHHEGFFLAPTPQDEEQVAIASNAQGVVLVGYASRSGTEPWRIRARWVNGPDAGVGPGQDGGSLDGGSCAGVAPPPSNSCSAVGTPFALGALLLFAARLRRRRR